MNKKLSLLQALAALLVVLGLAGVFIWRYLTAPAYPAEDPRDKPLYNTAVTEIALTLGELAPRRVSEEATSRPRGGGGTAGGAAVTPKGEAAQKEARRYATEVAPKYAKVAETLRQAGIPVASEDLAKKAAEGRVPLIVAITLEGNGTVVENQPSHGVMGYKVELKRDVYTSPQAATGFRVNVASELVGEVGVTSPETLAQKQDEALEAALRAIIARWKADNPAPASK